MQEEMSENSNRKLRFCLVIAQYSTMNTHQHVLDSHHSVKLTLNLVKHIQRLNLVFITISKLYNGFLFFLHLSFVLKLLKRHGMHRI